MTQTAEGLLNTGATLTRFYALHISVLPGLTFLIIALHVLLVQKHGMSVPLSVERSGAPLRSLPFLPNFLLRDLLGWLLVLAILATMAAFFPAHLGEKADAFASAPEGIRPEWYFMFMFQTLKYLPGHILGIEGELLGVMGFGLAGVLLLVVPFLDRRTARGEPHTVWTYAGLFALLYIVALTYLGYTASTSH